MKTRFIPFILALLFFSGCDVLQQVGQMANLSKCEFRMQSVQNLTLSGVNVQNIHKFSDLSILDGAKLMAAVANNSFPLDFTLNLEVRNPNTAAAGLTRMEWILFIDDIEMTRGTLNQAVSIPPNNGIAVIPMQFHFDLKQVLSGKSADAIVNFGLNLAGAGNTPTRFKMQLQPTINVGNFPVTYPGYITIGTTFGS